MKATAVLTLLLVASLAQVHTIDPSDCDFHQLLYKAYPPTPATSSVSWHLPLTTPSHTHPCKRQGVLKVTPPAGKSKTRVTFLMFAPDDWSFHIADSETNNGYGGDSGTSKGWAAEIHNVNKDLYIYENVQDQVGTPVASTIIPNYFDAFTVQHANHYNISIAANPPIIGDSDTPTDVNIYSTPEVPRTTIKMTNNEMFRYDTFYVGLNRVVYPSTTTRVGIGACQVCIRFFD